MCSEVCWSISYEDYVQELSIRDRDYVERREKKS